MEFQKIDTKKWKGQYTVKVKVKDKNNALLTQNFIDFEVFNPRDLKAPRGRVALLDFNGKLKKFLQKNEVQTVDFNSRTPKNIPVLVSTHKAENEKELKHFERLLKFVESGGTAVFLDRLKDSVTAENTITPFTAKVHPSKGLWTCIPHIANDHPVFDGLQDSGFLRNTYENIMETGYFTINHIHKKILKDAHHTSAKYDKNISEFNVTNLKTDYKDNFYAPFVKNCPVQLAMKYVEEYDIKANNTKLVIGEIQGLYIKENLLEEDGFINLSKGAIAAINGLDGYTIPNLKQRFEYQRPII